MNTNSIPDRDHLLDLLADQATQGLSDVELAELHTLLHGQEDLDGEAVEYTAAAIDLALQPAKLTPMPADLSQRIAQDAVKHLQHSNTPTLPMTPPTNVAFRRQTIVEPAPRPESTTTWLTRLNWLGWVVAAACLLIAVQAWLASPGDNSQTPISLKDQLTRMVAIKDTIQLPGGPVNQQLAPKAAGEVVWNGQKQAGFLVLRDLPVNDPSKHQYQLWIFDANRTKHPVDGGVFDVSNSDDILIPIRSKLPVGQAVQFAITRERPGGVVVSDQKEIVFLAKRPV